MPFLPCAANSPALTLVLKNQQTPVAPLPPLGAEPISEYETWDAEKLFQFGTYLLKSGRNFNRAAQVFAIAARKQPRNVDYQLALGCAYACRFASVRQAAVQVANLAYQKETYPARQADWEKGQKDPKAPNYGKPAPAPPAQTSLTPDDARPFVLSPEESRQELIRLAKQSLAAFSEAQKLIPSLAVDKQGEASYIRGWGLFTLRREGRGRGGRDQGVIIDVPPALPKEKADESRTEQQPSDLVVLSPEAVSECFRASVKTDNNSPRYGQSLGFALVPDYLDGVPSGGGSTVSFWEGASPYKAETLDEAIHAFEQVLTSKPNDFDTLYSLALITAQARPSVSVSYLEKAARRQKSNSAIWYLLAETQFRQAVKQDKNTGQKIVIQKKAIDNIERGNVAPNYEPNAIPLPLPTWLRAAWKYRPVQGYGSDERVLSILFTRAGSYLKQEDSVGHNEEMLRGASALMGMGLKAVDSVANDSVLGQGNLYDLWPTGLSSRVIMGVVNCYGAYDAVRDSQKARPDEQKARFLDKNANILDYIKAIDKEVTNSN